MTVAEAEALLGPRLVDQVRGQPCPPLTPQQIQQLAPRLAHCEALDELPRTA